MGDGGGWTGGTRKDHRWISASIPRKQLTSGKGGRKRNVLALVLPPPLLGGFFPPAVPAAEYFSFRADAVPQGGVSKTNANNKQTFDSIQLDVDK